MKPTYRYALTLASAALLCGTAAAQDRAAPGAARSTVEHVATRHLEPGDKRASEIIGATVKNTTGDDIGRVEDLIVSGKNNVATAVVGVGGVLGLGAKRIGIDYGDLEVSPDGRTAYLDLTQAQIDAAPAFEYDADDDGAAASTRSPARPATTDTDRRETQIARNDDNRARPAADAAAPSRTANNRDTGATKSVDTKADAKTADRTLKTGELNAKALIGANVVDASNEKVGKIRDLIVAPSGVQAVMMIGGNGIISGRLVAVPYSSLKIEPAEVAGGEPERVQTSMTASQLEALPAFRYN